MWIHKLPPKRESRNFHQKRTLYLKKQFQVRYTLYLVGALVTTLALAGFPVYFFMNQNYQMFMALANEKAPDLLKSLELEKAWLVRILLGTVLFSLFFYVYFGLKWTSRMVGPLLVLQNHLQRLARGDLSAPQVRVRENDEFQDLIAAYNYFYLSLRQKTILDVEKIKKLEPSPNDRRIHAFWNELITERKYQLNLLDEVEKKSIVNAVSDSQSPGSRHAS